MGGQEDLAARKYSGTAPTSSPWIDEVTFTLSNSVSHENGRISRSPPQTTSRAKREIPRLDLGKLFSRRKSSKTPYDVTSPLATPESGEFDTQPKPSPQVWQQITTNPWGIRIRKAKSATVADLLDPRANGLDVENAGFQSPKIHVRKPPPGIKYWFDGVEDDGASVRSEPGGRPSLSSEKSLSRRNRDTFLSVSSGMSPSSASSISSESIEEDSPMEKLNDYDMSATPTRKRASTLSVSPTDPFTRPVSKRSVSSVSTLRMNNHLTYRNAPTPTPSRQQQLPDSINKGESVLVLSETDDSDEEENNEDGEQSETRYEDCLDVFALRSPTDAACTGPDQVVPPERTRHTDLAAKRLNNVPDLISHTSIEERSQVSMDDHSPRTSLLSDLRTISFRSSYRPMSFRTEDRPLSIDTYRGSERSPTWLTSPTATVSQITPPSELATFLSEPSLPMSRPHTATQSQSSVKAQRIMVVTDEEARLLASIRRKRAEMDQERQDARSIHEVGRRPAQSPLKHHRRPSTADPASGRRSGSQQTTPNAVAGNVPSSPPTRLKHGSQDGLLSPVSLSDDHVRRPSSGTVQQVWGDVQEWRKRPGTPPAQPSSDHRPPLPRIETAARAAPPFPWHHLSPDTVSSGTASPRTRMALAQRMASDGAIKTRPRTDLLDETHVRPSKRRSQSLGDKLARRDKTDVQKDVLAAWGDLGGCRKNSVGVTSPVPSSNV